MQFFSFERVSSVERQIDLELCSCRKPQYNVIIQRHIAQHINGPIHSRTYPYRLISAQQSGVRIDGRYLE